MTDLSTSWRQIEQAIRQANPAECPAFLGELERLKALAQFRLVMEAGPNGHTDTHEALLTMAEAAKRLNIPESRAYELARQRKLHAVRIGKYVRVSPHALAKYQAQLPSV